ncbi:NUDIX domain-containing protein [Herbivorax sp. ANBcel31]|uniref:NUDIX hydrolase n=1 Tax=Herbivorax sp. ANBcel31 TaxID=3069754 RepID=UPI0027B71CF0|nr:NUDIX domain-containing protein [Herbivorax sp. ANBcel31]MDQ2085922.1 NUDIX domain-containing protein [Herbivorax sp. ANBcel31]
MYKNVITHFTVSGFVFYKGKVLLIKHKKFNKWIYPGGHIENNETPEEALIREVKEETNYDISIIKSKRFSYEDEYVKMLNTPFCILHEYIPQYDNEKNHFHIDLVYLCKLKFSILKDKERKKNIGWYTFKEALQLDMFKDFKKVMQEAFLFIG